MVVPFNGVTSHCAWSLLKTKPVTAFHLMSLNFKPVTGAPLSMKSPILRAS